MTIKVKPMTAKNRTNQDALDRLVEMRVKAEQNPNSNFVFTLKKACNSLQACDHPITTRKEALALKNVGPKLAQIMCPQDAAPATSITATTRKIAPKTSVVSKTKLTQRTLGPDNTLITASSKTKNEAGPSGKQKAYEKAKAHAESLVLPEAPWKAILLIDGRERNSKNIVSRCMQAGIPSEERHLPIGDMAWIARCDTLGLEVMLGTIIERKEVSDLASSLFGSRYLEQRLRLQHSGLPQVLFLVEGNINSVMNCPAETLRMAMMETRVQLGFQVLQTTHMDDTIQVLKGLHRRIVQRTFPEAFSELPTFSNSPSANRNNRKRRRPTSLRELEFDTAPTPPFSTERFITYPELKAKVERDREAGTRPVGALYHAMLKQVSTLSHKKCQAVSEEYPTLRALLTAYEQSDDPQQMVGDLPCDRQKVGPKSSANLFVACCTERDGSIPPSRTPKKPPPKSRSKAPGSSSLARSTSLSRSGTASTSASLPSLASIQVRQNSGASSCLPRPMSVLDSPPGSPFGNSTSSPYLPERKPPAKPTSRPQSAAATCFDLTEDTPQKPKFPSRILATATAPSPLVLDSDIESPFRNTTTKEMTQLSTSNHDTRGHTVSTPSETKRVLLSSAWSSSAASSATTFHSPEKVKTHVAKSPARSVTLDSCDESMRETKPSYMAAKKLPQPRQSMSSSGTPLFSSPSSVPVSSQSTLGSTISKSNSKKEISILEILDSDEEEDIKVATAVSLSDSGSPNMDDGLRARLAKRTKHEDIEIIDIN